MPQRLQQLTQSKNDASDWKPVDDAHFIISHPKWMKHGIRTGFAIRCLIDARWETLVNTDDELFVLPVLNFTVACRSSRYRSIWKINEKTDGTFLQDRPGTEIGGTGRDPKITKESGTGQDGTVSKNTWDGTGERFCERDGTVIKQFFCVPCVPCVPRWKINSNLKQSDIPHMTKRSSFNENEYLSTMMCHMNQVYSWYPAR